MPWSGNPFYTDGQILAFNRAGEGAVVAGEHHPRESDVRPSSARGRRHPQEQQIADALVVLRKAKADFEVAGYEVETIRVTTQPLAELVAEGFDRDTVARVAAPALPLPWPGNPARPIDATSRIASSLMP